MQTSHRNLFTTIRTEGAILPADLLGRISEGDRSVPGLIPTDYHLAKGETVNEAVNRSWNRMLGAWSGFRTALARLQEGEAGTTETRERWLLPLFQELGYGRLVLSRGIQADGRDYPVSHAWGNVPIHLVSARVDLDRRTAGVVGAARSSPHSMLQELLNASTEHQWGFVSNGRLLRILRDNSSLTRQAYVEFDLEAMMDGDVYSDFVMLWLLCHQSRVEGEKKEEWWLERWSRTAQEQGTRALEQLRRGVEEAITVLGRGFLAHPENKALRARLRAGELSGQDYYRQLLRLVYRLLFLFAAEDRDLLLDPKAEREARSLYMDYYSTQRLRRLAAKQRGTRHSDLFYTLRVVMEKLGGDDGCPELGLPALDSFLFYNGGSGAMPDLEGAELANHDLLGAVRDLAYTVDGNTRRPVDYRNMGSEELGSVYEALLELHPRLNADAATFELGTAGGNERKTTGSYYTPTSLITSLLDSALDSVLEEAARKPDPEAAILDLKVCDPACGSGHFLIAAAHRIAKRLAAVRTGDDEPAPEAIRTAVRDVIGRCIYGVDINPMSVELCKVSLWMEALEPGKPLSFLDHHIQVGNSLLGATPALLDSGIPDAAFEPIEGDDRKLCSEYKKRNKTERSGQMYLFDVNSLQPWDRLGNFASAMMGLEDIPDDTIEGLRRKQHRYEELVRSSDYLYGRLWADAWCAAFVWKKNKEFAYPITQAVFRKIERNPFDVALWMREEIERLAGQYQFFHWHLAFPDVFRVPMGDEGPENEQAGWSGGFDVVLGNPPWERVKLQEKEWFALYNPDIATSTNAAVREQLLNDLAISDAILFRTFKDAGRQADAESHFVHSSGRYPLTGLGDINTYALFAETNRLIMGSAGRVGCIVQSDIATSEACKEFFSAIMSHRQLVSFYDFVNEEGLFPAVHRSHPHFCLLTLASAPQRSPADFAFWNTNVGHLSESERHFTLFADEINLLNPNTRTCPIFRSKEDAELTKAIYRRIAVLVNDQLAENPWSLKIQRVFDMNKPKVISATRTTEKLLDLGVNLDGRAHVEHDGESWLPIFEGKMVLAYNHRAAGVRIEKKNAVRAAQSVPSTTAQLMDPDFIPFAAYWMPRRELTHVIKQDEPERWVIGYRDITTTITEKTIQATILPYACCNFTIRCAFLRSATAALTCCFLANLNSHVLDYVARQSVPGLHLSDYIVKQLPVLAPNVYSRPASWDNDKLTQEWIWPRVLELTYTATNLAHFARECGYEGPAFTWNDVRRFDLRCELDAAYFHIYGISRDKIMYIMETFSVLKKSDLKKHRTYRTRDTILAIYDDMQRAIETGVPYRTRLDPPPADPLVSHPA